MTLPASHDVLYMTLPVGRENAEPIGSLAERLNWPRRMVEQAITDCRLLGRPVASDGHGIWVGDKADMESTAKQLRGRLVSQYRTFLAVRKTARRMDDVVQTTLWEAA